MAILKTVLYLLVYPGFIFLLVYSTFCEWFDRKVYARLQNRMGPTHTGRFGMLQPVADIPAGYSQALACGRATGKLKPTQPKPALPDAGLPTSGGRTR